MTAQEAKDLLTQFNRSPASVNPHRKWIARLLERAVSGEVLSLSQEFMLKRGLAAGGEQ